MFRVRSVSAGAELDRHPSHDFTLARFQIGKEPLAANTVPVPEKYHVSHRLKRLGDKIIRGLFSPNLIPIQEDNDTTNGINSLNLRAVCASGRSVAVAHPHFCGAKGQGSLRGEDIAPKYGNPVDLIQSQGFCLDDNAGILAGSGVGVASCAAADLDIRTAEKRIAIAERNRDNRFIPLRAPKSAIAIGSTIQHFHAVGKLRFQPLFRVSNCHCSGLQLELPPAHTYGFEGPRRLPLRIDRNG